MTALTDLRDDERLFFDTVALFARDRIAPKVREMDETAHFDPTLLAELFELGNLRLFAAERTRRTRRYRHFAQAIAEAIVREQATGAR